MNKRKDLAYPRAFVYLNIAGDWSLAWRDHPDYGNHWDEPISFHPRYGRDDLTAAHTTAANRVTKLWTTLGRGTA